MTINIEKIRADQRWEARKFVLQMVVTIAAAIGAGAGLGSYFTRQSPSKPTFPPGTVITIPGAAR